MRDDEGLQRFLNEAANHRLLSAEEEKALGRIAHPTYLRDLKHSCSDCKACRARHELVNCNIRLVINIARYYRNRGLPMADVIQNGIVGLDKAARKFDPERNIRFSTYATLWIKQAIQRGLTSGGSTIRLPSQVAGRRARSRALQAKEPERSLDDIAAELDISEEDHLRALAAAEVVTSLDREMFTDDFAYTLLDSQVDPHAYDPQDVVPDFSPVRGYVKRLAIEERRVIELCFGLKDGRPRTIKEVAAKLDISLNSAKERRRVGLAQLAEHPELRNMLDSTP